MDFQSFGRGSMKPHNMKSSSNSRGSNDKKSRRSRSSGLLNIDNPRAHSILVREIEELLKHLMIDYNDSIIIQMSFQEKTDIKMRLLEIIRAKSSDFIMDQFECLSESKLDLNPAALNDLLKKRRNQKSKVVKNFNNSANDSSKNSRKEAM